jgi:hypothetical protein
MKLERILFLLPLELKQKIVEYLSIVKYQYDKFIYRNPPISSIYGRIYPNLKKKYKIRINIIMLI